MLKRRLPFLLLIVLALPVGFYRCSHPKEEVSTYRSEAITVVPDDAVWIIESRSVPDLLHALTRAEPLFPALQQIGIINPHLQALRKIDSLIAQNPRFKDLYGRSSAVVSLHQTSKSQYQFLVILENQGAAGVTTAGELFANLCGQTGQWSERTYNGQQINRITFGVDALIPGISLSGNSKYLVLSPSPILIENTVRQMNQKTGLYTSRAFDKLSHTAGKTALADVYVNLKAVPAWLSGTMNAPVKKKMEAFTRYGDWASFDISIRKDALWMNGFALEGDTLNSYLNMFKNQAPGKMEAEQYLPSTTAAYLSMVVEKPEQYLKSLTDYLGGGESGRKRQRAVEKANAQARDNVVKTWTDLGYREITIGYLCGVSNDSIEKVALINLKNIDGAIKKLHNKLLPSLKQLHPDGQHTYDLNVMPFEKLPEILGGGLFDAVTGKYFTSIGNVLVLADQLSVLEDFVHKYALNKTLVNDAAYQSLAGMISTRSNVTFFAFPYRARPLLQKILDQEAASTLFANEQFLVKTGAFGLQFQSSNGMLLHNIFTSFAPINYLKPQTLWESKLDANVATKPALVTNFTTKEQEIMVQDELNNLYLLNASGRIIWKINIGEPIKSEIFQIDLLKNGRLQYLFSTAKAIHLMDKNGKYLPKYPLKLNAPATNGMSLFDFDGNKDYRIMIACMDNKVYAFDKNANPIKAWKFGSTSGAVTWPIQNVKLQDKDYIVFYDPVKVYILDRKGAVKVSPEKDFAVSANNPLLFDPAVTGIGPHFILTDVDGNVCTIGLDGTVTSKKLGSFSPDHYFTMMDFDRDGQNDYIFIDRNKMEVLRQSGEKILTRKLNGLLAFPAEVYLFNDKLRRLGMTIPSKNELLIYNSDGSMYNGFPVTGQTPFIIGNIDQSSTYQNLLVGSEGGYLFNYAIK